jgi:hypothetical protein
MINTYRGMLRQLILLTILLSFGIEVAEPSTSFVRVTPISLCKTSTFCIVQPSPKNLNQRYRQVTISLENSAHPEVTRNSDLITHSCNLLRKFTILHLSYPSRGVYLVFSKYRGV